MCELITVPAPEYPHLVFDFGSTQTFTTVYLMGSVKNNADLSGIRIYAAIDAYNRSLCAIVDGSGFYDCGGVGRYLELEKPVEGGAFTICDVTFYKQTNILMSVDPALSNQSTIYAHNSAPIIHASCTKEI